MNTAARLCRANKAVIFRLEGGVYRFAAGYSLDPAYLEIERQTPISPGPETVIGRAAMSRQVARIHDAWTDPLYEKKEDAKIGGHRSMIGVPLMREGEPVGVIGLSRSRVDPFSEHEIELVTTFANQAVIAIENVRLFEAEQQRTRELAESLEQQTATSNVLDVISRSAFDLRVVFETVAESSVRLCAADRAFIMRFDGEMLRMAVAYNVSQEFKEFVIQNPFRPGRHSPAARVALERRTVHIPDVLADLEYKYGAKTFEAFRTVLGVPILKDENLLGVIIIYHVGEVRPFTDKQIALVETFADQAAIAIENVRLFEAEQARTRELTESLEQQTATSEVLKVISRSTFDLQTVLDTLVESAARLCAAELGVIMQRDGDVLLALANFGFSSEQSQYAKEHPLPGNRASATGRAAIEGRAVHIPDVMTDPEYRATGHQQSAGYRTILAVPLLRDGATIGVFGLMRDEVNPFTDKQIELVTTFADQAVIAIENVRLFNETNEALEQQTAASEVLRVISSSPGDLKPVFQTMLENATRICEAKFGTLFRFDGKMFYAAADVGSPPELSEYLGRPAFEPLPGGHLDRVLRTKQLFHTVDDAAEAVPGPAARLAGARSTLCVPMLKDDALIGAIVIYRQEVRPFTDKQIELLTNFAAQAAIGIENTRLLNELRELLQQQTATADVLKVISRSAFELLTVLDTLLRSAARLCEADQGTITQRKGDTFYRSVSYGFPDAFADYVKDRPVELGRDTAAGRALLEGKVIHIPDVQADPDYTWTEAQRLGAFRTILGVPMLREGIPVGVLTLTRSEVRRR